MEEPGCGSGDSRILRRKQFRHRVTRGRTKFAIHAAVFDVTIGLVKRRAVSVLLSVHRILPRSAALFSSAPSSARLTPRNKKRSGPRLPRRLPGPPQDLRKARIHLLGLSRRTSRGAKSPRCPGTAPTHQAALRHRLTAPTFAPITRPVMAPITWSDSGQRRGQQMDGLATPVGSSPVRFAG